MRVIRRYPVRTSLGLITFVALTGVGLSGLSGLTYDEAVMRVEPSGGTISVGGTFTKHVIVESHVPTNVFRGEIHFDADQLVVEEISYNTSIADLWAESPWYSQGEGTISFIGGTTDPGGFVGSGVLLSVTYRSRAPGESTIHFADARILHHDGLGVEIETVHTPIDTIVAAPEEDLAERTLFRQSFTGPTITSSQPERSFDLSGDGRHSLADLSIFMHHLLTQNLRSDFNGDGVVNLTDLSMLMNAINNE